MRVGIVAKDKQCIEWVLLCSSCSSRFYSVDGVAVDFKLMYVATRWAGHYYPPLGPMTKCLIRAEIR